MKVLHLFSNAKWTGPAEPALNLCLALRRRGIEADFACAPDAGKSINKIVETARDRGIEPVLRFHLRKHRNPILNAIDRAALLRYLRSHPFDLIHCHLDNDHRIAIHPALRAGVPVVRSTYYGEGVPARGDLGKVLAAADFLIEPSRLAREHDADAFAYPRERMRVVPGAVDTERFDPARSVPDGRSWLGVPHDAFVVGIVARMQTHRRYEDFFRAIRRLADERDNVYVIVVGRGTRQEEVGFGPVRELGLTDRVRFSGYVDGENYVGMLKAFDAKVYLVPGSDGTCRAVREAMAMARPAIVADRGMLREIVDDGTNGVVFDGTAEGLYRALAPLAADRARARRMGQAARAKALAEFSLDAQAKAVAEVYEAVLAARRAP